jgi:cytochrome c5
MQAISRILLAAGAMLVAVVACTAATRAEAPVVTSAIAPGSATQQLPDGPGKELVAKLCAGCHDLTFTISTRETEEGWTRIVNDMRSKGADGSEEDFAKVIAYLTANMGKP